MKLFYILLFITNSLFALPLSASEKGIGPKETLSNSKLFEYTQKTTNDGFPVEKAAWAAGFTLNKNTSVADLKKIVKSDVLIHTKEYFQAFEKEKGVSFNEAMVLEFVDKYYKSTYESIEDPGTLERVHYFPLFRGVLTRFSLLKLVEYNKLQFEKINAENTKRLNSLEEKLLDVKKHITQ